MVKKYPQLSPKEIIDASPSDDETQGLQFVDGAGFPVLTFDADDYREHVRDMGLSESQEDELLQALWSIVVGFVDLGYGIKTKNRLEMALLNASNKDDDSSGGTSSMITPIADNVEPAA